MTAQVTTAQAVALTRLPRHRLWHAARNGLIPHPLKVHHKLVLWDKAAVVEFGELTSKAATNNHKAAKQLAARIKEAA